MNNLFRVYAVWCMLVPHSCENKAISAPSWAWAWAWAELGKNTECPLCKIEGCEDSQEHILQNCSILENITKEKSDKLNYKKLYENDSESLIEIARK